VPASCPFLKNSKKKGIVIDTQKTYGSVLKTLSLREFDELARADRSSLTDKDCPLPY
jgi:RAB protein geranylgeranyltransferase component A